MPQRRRVHCARGPRPSRARGVPEQACRARGDRGARLARPDPSARDQPFKAALYIDRMKRRSFMTTTNHARYWKGSRSNRSAPPSASTGNRRSSRESPFPDDGERSKVLPLPASAQCAPPSRGDI
jgi:hypothetical protein